VVGRGEHGEWCGANDDTDGWIGGPAPAETGDQPADADLLRHRRHPGAGIYARVGGVAGEVGGAIWLSFLVAMTLAIFTACSYVELVTKYPGAAGAALYVHTSYRMRFLTFIVAFAVLASGIASAGAVVRTFGGRYLDVFVEVPDVPVAIGVLLVLALINFRGVSESVKVNIALTVIELSGLLLIVVIGVAALAVGDGDPGRAFTFTDECNAALAVLGGAAVAFYAMLGFEDAVNMAEETREPTRVFPRALLGGMALAGVLYLVIGFTAAMLVAPETLAGSTGPLLEVVNAGPLDISPRFFSAIALIAVTNTALINLIMASRVVYGMARKGVIPSLMGITSPARRTPWVAILFTTAIAVVLVTVGDLGQLADTTVALLLLVFILVNITLLVLRRRPVDHAHFRTPTILPVLGAVSSAVLLVKLLYDDVQEDGTLYLLAGGLLLLGVALWVINHLACGRFGAVDVDAEPAVVTP
jgi:basic amino acid/polyamine antiporter, APA family